MARVEGAGLRAAAAAAVQGLLTAALPQAAPALCRGRCCLLLRRLGGCRWVPPAPAPTQPAPPQGPVPLAAAAPTRGLGPSLEPALELPRAGLPAVQPAVGAAAPRCSCSSCAGPPEREGCQLLPRAWAVRRARCGGLPHGEAVSVHPPGDCGPLRAPPGAGRTLQRPPDPPPPALQTAQTQTRRVIATCRC